MMPTMPGAMPKPPSGPGMQGPPMPGPAGMPEPGAEDPEQVRQMVMSVVRNVRQMCEENGLDFDAIVSETSGKGGLKPPAIEKATPPKAPEPKEKRPPSMPMPPM